MTIDSLIQIVALIVAVYALVPRVRQLELKMRFGVMLWVSSILYMVVVTILLYYSNLRKLDLIPKWPSDWVFYPSDIAYFTTIFLVIFLLVEYRYSKLSRFDLKRLQELAEELLRREEFPELISLLDRYWDRLVQFQINNFFFPRIKFQLNKYLLDTSPDEEMKRLVKKLSALILDVEDKKKPFRGKSLSFLEKVGEFVKKIIRFPVMWLYMILPSYSESSNVADNLIKTIVLNESFVNTLSRVRPYFAIRILESGFFFQRIDFLYLYVKCLIRNPQSIIYSEILNIYMSSGKNDKEISKSNCVIRFLLNDSNEAKKMHIWNPVGDETLHFLEEMYIHPERDSFNLPVNDFGGTDTELEHSQINLGIKFFDIMVTRALYQGLEDHMWLQYLHLFVKKIVQNYSPRSSVDLSSEYPIRYSKFLYEIINVYHGWINVVQYSVSPMQSDEMLKNISGGYENRNIPKSSIISLGLSLEYILFAEIISERYKEYLMGIVFRFYFELRKNPLTEEYGRAYFDMLKGRGVFENIEFRDKVMLYFHRLDKITYQIWSQELVQEFLES